MIIAEEGTYEDRLAFSAGIKMETETSGSGVLSSGTPEDTSLRTGKEQEGFKHIGEKLSKTWPAKAVQSILGNIDTFNKAARGEIEPDEAVNAVSGLALDLGIGGISTAGARPGIGMFGGVGAMRKSPEMMASVREAQDLLAKGTPVNDVYHRTGIMVGPDERVRFEISDQDARLITENLTPNKYSVQMQTRTPLYESPYKIPILDEATGAWVSQKELTVGDILHHPELYKHYPEIKDIKFGFPGYGLNSKGWYDDEIKKIGLAGGSSDEMLSTLLHEVQHYIQYKEGHAIGGNPGQFIANYDEFQIAKKETKETAKRLGETAPIKETRVITELGYILRKDIEGKPITPREEKLLNQMMEDHPGWTTAFRQNIKDLFSIADVETQAYEQYIRLFGEAESRLTQARKDKGELERRWFPAYTEGMLEPLYPGGIVPPEYLKFDHGLKVVPGKVASEEKPPNISRLERPANDNKKSIQINPTPYEEALTEKQWADLAKRFQETLPPDEKGFRFIQSTYSGGVSSLSEGSRKAVGEFMKGKITEKELMLQLTPSERKHWTEVWNK